MTDGREELKRKERRTGPIGNRREELKREGRSSERDYRAETKGRKEATNGREEVQRKDGSKMDEFYRKGRARQTGQKG